MFHHTLLDPLLSSHFSTYFPTPLRQFVTVRSFPEKDDMRRVRRNICCERGCWNWSGWTLSVWRTHLCLRVLRHHVPRAPSVTNTGLWSPAVRFGTRTAIITIAKLQHVSHQVFHNRTMPPDVVTANSCVQRNSGLTRPAPITDHVVATLSRTVT